LSADENVLPPTKSPAACTDGVSPLATGTLANIILSRELIVTGLFRHFSEWKERIFRYDRGSNLLIIEFNTKKYELKMNNLLVKEHPYHNTQVVDDGALIYPLIYFLSVTRSLFYSRVDTAVSTDGHCLLLTYTNANNNNLHAAKTMNKDELIEMMMLFPSKEEKDLWKVTLGQGIAHELEQIVGNNDKKVKLMLNYLNERHVSLRLLTHSTP